MTWNKNLHCVFSVPPLHSLSRAFRPWSSISWALKMVNKHFLLEHGFITLLFSFGCIHRLCFIGLDLAGIESHLGSRNDIGMKLSERCDLTYLIRTQNVLNAERRQGKKGNSHKAVNAHTLYVGVFLKRISKESHFKNISHEVWFCLQMKDKEINRISALKCKLCVRNGHVLCKHLIIIK